MENKIDVSIVIPVYNSAICIEAFVGKLVSVLEASSSTFEILLIDDYSKDASWEKIKLLKSKYGSILKAVKLSRNFGQHNATFCGIKKAIGDIVITIDDDFQHAPEDVVLLIEAMKKNHSEVVYALFKKRELGLFRMIFKKIIGMILFVQVFNEGFKELSSFRAFNKRIKDKISASESAELNLDELIRWHTESISSVFVKHYPSQKGKSGYSSLKIFTYASKTMVITSDYSLRILAKAGFLLAFISGLTGLYFLFQKFFNGVSVQGYTSIIVSILFSSGFIIYTLSFMTLYLSNIFKNQAKKPPFSEEEEL